MSYKDIMAKSLQESATTEIHIHPMDNLYIMEINYENIINLMVENLFKAGYTIITSSSSQVG